MKAIDVASEAESLSLKTRLQNYGFTVRYKGTVVGPQPETQGRVKGTPTSTSNKRSTSISRKKTGTPCRRLAVPKHIVAGLCGVPFIMLHIVLVKYIVPYILPLGQENLTH